MLVQQSRKTLIGAIFIGLAALAAYALANVLGLGWLGAGLIGIVVLVIALRADIYRSHAMSVVHRSAAETNSPAKQPVQQLRANSEKCPGRADASDRDARILSFARGVGIVMTILGFGMFLLFQSR